MTGVRSLSNYLLYTAYFILVGGFSVDVYQSNVVNIQLE